jgi:hypothetical protein
MTHGNQRESERDLIAGNDKARERIQRVKEKGSNRYKQEKARR